MTISKILYADATIEDISPENGKFTEEELLPYVGPARMTAPVTDDGSGPFFSLEEDGSGPQYRVEDYVVVADANKIGEENLLAAVLAGSHEFFGTALLIHKDHLP